MSSQKNKIYILLPVFNRSKITADFARCLVKQTHQDYYLLLIDDGCTDDTCKVVSDIVPSSNLEIINTGGNKWWAGSLETGFKWLQNKNVDNSDIVLIINDDVIIEDNFLENGASKINTSAKTLWGARSYSMQSNKFVSAGFIIDWKNLIFTNTDSFEEADCLSTRGLFLSWDDFMTVGGFYPKLIPHYCSDLEFTCRAKQLGYSLKTSDDIKLFMNEETTGEHTIVKHSLVKFIKLMFSKRNSANPYAWIMFVLLRAPFSYKLQGVFFIVYRLFVNIYKRLKESLKTQVKKAIGRA